MQPSQNCFSLKLISIFYFKIDNITLDPDPGFCGSGSKFGKNPGSGYKFNVFIWIHNIAWQTGKVPVGTYQVGTSTGTVKNSEGTVPGRIVGGPTNAGHAAAGLTIKAGSTQPEVRMTAASRERVASTRSMEQAVAGAAAPNALRRCWVSPPRLAGAHSQDAGGPAASPLLWRRGHRGGLFGWTAGDRHLRRH